MSRTGPALAQLWAGWRADWVESATEAERAAASVGPDTAAAAPSGVPRCVFCALADRDPDDPEAMIVARGATVFTVLNAYPYSSGHLLVLPLRHTDRLSTLTDDESTELWEHVRRADAALHGAYSPDGLNIGANLGRAAGAGLPAHLHVHLVPRWSGDTNFMTTLAATRVMPEALATTWARVRRAWR